MVTPLKLQRICTDAYGIQIAHSHMLAWIDRNRRSLQLQKIWRGPLFPFWGRSEVYSEFSLADLDAISFLCQVHYPPSLLLRFHLDECGAVPQSSCLVWNPMDDFNTFSPC